MSLSTDKKWIESIESGPRSISYSHNHKPTEKNTNKQTNIYFQAARPDVCIGLCCFKHISTGLDEVIKLTSVCKSPGGDQSEMATHNRIEYTWWWPHCDATINRVSQTSADLQIQKRWGHRASSICGLCGLFPIRRLSGAQTFQGAAQHRGLSEPYNPQSEVGHQTNTSQMQRMYIYVVTSQRRLRFLLVFGALIPRHDASGIEFHGTAKHLMRTWIGGALYGLEKCEHKCKMHCADNKLDEHTKICANRDHIAKVCFVIPQLPKALKNSFKW